MLQSIVPIKFTLNPQQFHGGGPDGAALYVYGNGRGMAARIK